MKYYLAARFERHQEMQGVRDVLEALGHTVVSRWIDLHDSDNLEAMTAENFATNPAHCAPFAIKDLADIMICDAFVCFSGGGGRGGRHVETGYALAMAKKIIVVGPRENIFQCLPDIEHYTHWSHWAMTLGRDLSDTLSA